MLKVVLMMLLLLPLLQAIPVGSLLTDMTLEVTSSDLIVLEVVNKASSNGDIFSAIPVDALGTHYYVTAYIR